MAARGIALVGAVVELGAVAGLGAAIGTIHGQGGAEICPLSLWRLFLGSEGRAWGISRSSLVRFDGAAGALTRPRKGAMS